jgi:hypothetical protein
MPSFRRAEPGTRSFGCIIGKAHSVRQDLLVSVMAGEGMKSLESCPPRPKMLKV